MDLVSLDKSLSPRLFMLTYGKIMRASGISTTHAHEMG